MYLGRFQLSFFSMYNCITESLEAVQKRAIHITHNLTLRMLYSSMLLHVNLDSLATRREDLCRRFSVILWILHHVSTAFFLLPDPPLSPLGSDLHKSFLESTLVPSAIVPSYNMDLTTTSKPTFYHDLHDMLASSFFLQSCFVFYVFFVF